MQYWYSILMIELYWYSTIGRAVLLEQYWYSILIEQYWYRATVWTFL